MQEKYYYIEGDYELKEELKNHRKKNWRDKNNKEQKIKGKTMEMILKTEYGG